MANDLLSVARSAWWDARLDNWALYKAGVDSSRISATDGKWGECAPRPPPPLVGEAVDTDRLTRLLSGDHLLAITAWYVWTGTFAERAAQLPVPVHLNTLRNRVNGAKVRLDELWWERLSRSAELARF